MADLQDAVLGDLLAQAGLDAVPVEVTRMTGRGFTDDVRKVELGDGRLVVLRRWPEPRPPEFPREAFLVGQEVPAPRLLAASAHGSLVEFVPGRLLGDLIEDGRDAPAAWAAVGAAYRRVHAVGFPPMVAGRVEPDRIVLRSCDPVAVAHDTLAGAAAGLERRCPDVLAHLPAIRRAIDRCAGPLRAAPSSLRHGDVNMWNVLVDGDAAVPIDWDLPEVGDPAMEVALLDKHASLFNGHGLPPAFFDGYGPAAEPRTTLHRIVETASWVGSDDWDEFASDPSLPRELRDRAVGWLATLIAYLRALPAHLGHLDALITESGSEAAPGASARDVRGSC